jgi:EAL domain-containing protein (putative c-di-GMP-specific phosphodiesterase class I)
VSVNLSSKQFLQADLIGQISSALESTGLNSKNLKLEITESMVMENVENAVAMLNQVRSLGVELSIDDFGTGYSSLSYLHRFPVNTLKIDRSFVGRMSGNNENTEIVRTIIMLARNLNLNVVAEGCETREQLDLLREFECEFGQGYFFSKPVSPHECNGFIVESEKWKMDTSGPVGFETTELSDTALVM